MVYRGVLSRVCKKLLRRSPMAASSASYIAGARIWGWPAGPCDKCVARYVCKAERNASRSALHCSALMTLLPFQFPAGASPALLKALPACLVLVLVFAGHLRIAKLYEYMRVAHIDILPGLKSGDSRPRHKEVHILGPRPARSQPLPVPCSGACHVPRPLEPQEPADST